MMDALSMLILSIKLKFQEFCTKENGDVNIVSIVVLIGIAVLLAIVFKDAISNLIGDLLDTITSNATDAVNTPAN